MVAIPVTGKVYQIWPRTGEVYQFEWGEKRWWQELTAERFAKDAEARQVISLMRATKVHLRRAEAPPPEVDLAEAIHGGDESEEEA